MRVRSVERVTARRTLFPLLAALACAVLAALVWALAFHTGAGHRADAALLQRVAEASGGSLDSLAGGVAVLCNLIPYALLATIVTALAYGTHGGRGALVVAAVLVIPNAVTQVLKRVTATDRTDLVPFAVREVDPASWPSGHATAAMALALCAVLAAPAGWRAACGLLGLGLAAGVGLSVVMLGWHFPSDVAGGYLVAAAGACVGAAALPRAWPERLVFSRPDATAALADRSRHARG